jgi:predicted phosphodiesterase
MKTITIGDLHGRDCWKQVDVNKYDKVIFIGDYTDSFTAKDGEIRTNLLEITLLKKEHPDKVELLIGNHDFNYMFREDNFYCSGYRPSMHDSLWVIFNENKKLFKVAHQEGDYLFTHAGIHSLWYKNNREALDGFEGNYADKLNQAFNSRHYPIFYDVSRRRGGTSPAGSPLWADKSETNVDRFPVHQIVGHSRVNNIVTMPADFRGGYSITYTDCQDTVVDFYELEI